MKAAAATQMTPEQQAAHVEMIKATTAKTEAAMKPAMDLYRERSWLWHLSCHLELRDLERLNGILRRLSKEDMKRVAAFAEGLAEWSSPDPQSPDAQISDR